MGHINIPNSSVVYDNPKQVDQNTIVFPAGMVTPGYPHNVNGTLAGVTWVQNGPTALPQPGTYEAPPQANPVLFGKQPPSLSAGGIQIAGGTTVKNPA